jgi:hypothetical protein
LLINQTWQNESKDHFTLKNYTKNLLSYKGNVRGVRLEKRIGHRIADLYCTLHHSTENVAIEIQKSPISVNQLKTRTEDYNDNNVSVLWLLHATGDVTGEPKRPKRRENVKISTAERYLHMLYGGRVYYVDFHNYDSERGNDRVLIYALHYTVSSKRRYRDKRFFDGYTYYYIMNQDYIPLHSYNLCTACFNQYGIARFFDKNVVRALECDIMQLERRQNFKFKKLKNRALVKQIKKSFPKYNESVIEHALFNLYHRGKIDIRKGNLRRSLRKYYSKYQNKFNRDKGS